MSLREQWANDKRPIHFIAKQRVDGPFNIRVSERDVAGRGCPDSGMRQVQVQVTDLLLIAVCPWASTGVI